MAKLYSEASPDEWFAPYHRKFRLRCCDCHLVHNVDFRIVEGQVEVRFERNERSTAAARRHFKFSKE